MARSSPTVLRASLAVNASEWPTAFGEELRKLEEVYVFQEDVAGRARPGAAGPGGESSGPGPRGERALAPLARLVPVLSVAEEGRGEGAAPDFWSSEVPGNGTHDSEARGRPPLECFSPVLGFQQPTTELKTDISADGLPGLPASVPIFYENEFQGPGADDPPLQCFSPVPACRGLGLGTSPLNTSPALDVQETTGGMMGTVLGSSGRTTPEHPNAFPNAPSFYQSVVPGASADDAGIDLASVDSAPIACLSPAGVSRQPNCTGPEETLAPGCGGSLSRQSVSTQARPEAFGGVFAGASQQPAATDADNSFNRNIGAGLLQSTPSYQQHSTSGPGQGPAGTDDVPLTCLSPVATFRRLGPDVLVAENGDSPLSNACAASDVHVATSVGTSPDPPRMCASAPSFYHTAAQEFADCEAGVDHASAESVPIACVSPVGVSWPAVFSPRKETPPPVWSPSGQSATTVAPAGDSGGSLGSEGQQGFLPSAPSFYQHELSAPDRNPAGADDAPLACFSPVTSCRGLCPAMLGANGGGAAPMKAYLAPDVHEATRGILVTAAAANGSTTAEPPRKLASVASFYQSEATFTDSDAGVDAAGAYSSSIVCLSPAGRYRRPDCGPPEDTPASCRSCLSAPSGPAGALATAFGGLFGAGGQQPAASEENSSVTPQNAAHTLMPSSPCFYQHQEPDPGDSSGGIDDAPLVCLSPVASCRGFGPALSTDAEPGTSPVDLCFFRDAHGATSGMAGAVAEASGRAMLDPLRVLASAPSFYQAAAPGVCAGDAGLHPTGADEAPIACLSPVAASRLPACMALESTVAVVSATAFGGTPPSKATAFGRGVEGQQLARADANSNVAANMAPPLALAVPRAVAEHSVATAPAAVLVPWFAASQQLTTFPTYSEFALPLPTPSPPGHPGLQLATHHPGPDNLVSAGLAPPGGLQVAPLELGKFMLPELAPLPELPEIAGPLLGPPEYTKLLFEAAPLLTRTEDLNRAYLRLCEANAIHLQVHGVPSGEALYGLARCLSLGAGAALAASRDLVPELPPCQPDAPVGAVVEARLDLAATMVQSAALAGFADAARAAHDVDLEALRQRRPAHLAAALKRAPARSPAAAPLPGAEVATREPPPPAQVEDVALSQLALLPQEPPPLLQDLSLVKPARSAVQGELARAEGPRGPRGEAWAEALEAPEVPEAQDEDESASDGSAGSSASASGSGSGSSSNGGWRAALSGFFGAGAGEGEGDEEATSRRGSDLDGRSRSGSRSASSASGASDVGSDVGGSGGSAGSSAASLADGDDGRESAESDEGEGGGGSGEGAEPEETSEAGNSPEGHASHSDSQSEGREAEEDQEAEELGPDGPDRDDPLPWHALLAEQLRRAFQWEW